jgi:RNA polymerase sigma-70 factor (ECF subfamily)
MTGTVTTQHDIINLIPALRRFARRLCTGRLFDAEDLVQETLLRAIANLDKFQPGTNLKSWLFTIMKNTNLTKCVRGRREVVGINDIGGMSPSLLPTQEWTIRGHEFERAMEDLSPTQRQAATKVLIDGSPYEDAAVAFGCALGTVKSRVSRARDALARSLGDTVGAAAQI